jgi:predicted dehydrogenase
LDYITELYPHIKVTKDSNEVCQEETLDIIEIVASVSIHYNLARQTLKHNKYIFMEKPMTANFKDIGKNSLVGAGDL